MKQNSVEKTNTALGKKFKSKSYWDLAAAYTLCYLFAWAHFPLWKHSIKILSFETDFEIEGSLKLKLYISISGFILCFKFKKQRNPWDVENHYVYKTSVVQFLQGQPSVSSTAFFIPELLLKLSYTVRYYFAVRFIILGPALRLKE